MMQKILANLFSLFLSLNFLSATQGYSADEKLDAPARRQLEQVKLLSPYLVIKSEKNLQSALNAIDELAALFAAPSLEDGTG